MDSILRSVGDLDLHQPQPTFFIAFKEQITLRQAAEFIFEHAHNQFMEMELTGPHETREAGYQCYLVGFSKRIARIGIGGIGETSWCWEVVNFTGDESLIEGVRGAMKLVLEEGN